MAESRHDGSSTGSIRSSAASCRSTGSTCLTRCARRRGEASSKSASTLPSARSSKAAPSRRRRGRTAGSTMRSCGSTPRCTRPGMRIGRGLAGRPAGRRALRGRHRRRLLRREHVQPRDGRQQEWRWSISWRGSEAAGFELLDTQFVTKHLEPLRRDRDRPAALSGAVCSARSHEPAVFYCEVPELERSKRSCNRAPRYRRRVLQARRPPGLEANIQPLNTGFGSSLTLRSTISR